LIERPEEFSKRKANSLRDAKNRSSQDAIMRRYFENDSTKT